MKLLARLLSHGFAIVVVVLLATGFIYRGELFPEWDLPDFLALDSTESTADDTSAGKIEPAPIQDDRMASGPATDDQQASDVEDAAVSTADVAEAMPPVEEVAEYSAPVSAESAPVDASEAVEVDEAEMPAAPAVEEVAEFFTPVITESEPADASEAVEAGEAEMPVAPAVEEDRSATEAPALAVEEPPAPEVEEFVEEVTTPATEIIADYETTASPAAETAADSSAESATALATDETAAPDAGGMTDSTPPAPEAVTVPDVAGSAAPGPVVESAAPMPESIATDEVVTQDSASQAGAAMSYYQLLAAAREAYWLRDYQTAEGFYHRMIVEDPDNPDGYGELANIYFSQGSWEAAASAYYEAGLRLVQSGLLAQARELVDVIRGLNGPQADALDQEIQAARGSSQ